MQGVSGNLATERRALGRRGEEAAERLLKERGFAIIARNVRFRIGEIDLVAREGDVLVFVEVKTRKAGGLASGFESIGPGKRRRLVRAARHWIARNGLPPGGARFDAVSVEVERDGSLRLDHLRNAFDLHDLF